MQVIGSTERLWAEVTHELSLFGVRHQMALHVELLVEALLTELAVVLAIRVGLHGVRASVSLQSTKTGTLYANFNSKCIKRTCNVSTNCHQY